MGWIFIFSTIAVLNLIMSIWVFKSRSLKNQRRILIIFGIWLLPLFGAAFALIRLTISGSINNTSDPNLGDDELGLAQEGFRKSPELMKSMKRNLNK